MRLPKFMAIHTMPEPVEAHDQSIGEKVKEYSTLDAYWVGSWVQMSEDGKIIRAICEWNAKDSASIQEVLDRIPELPTDGIYPMTKFDAEDLRK